MASQVVYACKRQLVLSYIVELPVMLHEPCLVVEFVRQMKHHPVQQRVVPRSLLTGLVCFLVHSKHERADGNLSPVFWIATSNIQVYPVRLLNIPQMKVAVSQPFFSIWQRRPSILRKFKQCDRSNVIAPFQIRVKCWDFFALLYCRLCCFLRIHMSFRSRKQLQEKKRQRTGPIPPKEDCRGSIHVKDRFAWQL